MATQNHHPVSPQTATPKRPLGQKLLAVLLICIFLLVGLFTARYLLASKPKAKRHPVREMESIVRVKPLQAQSVTLEISAMGTVTATTLELKPRISGTVTALHPNFIQGGLIQKGEVVAELDATDYRLVLQGANNALQSAAMDLRIEEGSQAVAKREFELIREFSGSSVKEAPEDLALRQPQLAKAKAALASAELEKQKAQLNLERTRILAPFTSIILKRQVALGAQVTSQTPIVTLAEADVFYVLTALPESHLQMFDLPGANQHGAEVRVVPHGMVAGQEEELWQGRVYSLLGEAESGSLMAQFLVRIDDPLGQHPGRQLLLDSAVTLTIQGHRLEQCFKLPRAAVRPNDTVMLMDSEDRLRIRPVVAGWRDEDFVYATGGLEPGERLIISPVAAPIEGMKLQLAGAKKKQGKGKGHGPKQ
jgi:RND family efflux transporter MFP subunit